MIQDVRSVNLNRDTFLRNKDTTNLTIPTYVQTNQTTAIEQLKALVEKMEKAQSEQLQTLTMVQNLVYTRLP